MSSPSVLASPSGSLQDPAPPHFDFVSSDFDALSSHMAQCSAAQGRWSAVKGGLRQAHAIAAGRIVTMACIAVTAIVVMATFA